jgi:hypothetical protein
MAGHLDAGYNILVDPSLTDCTSEDIRCWQRSNDYARLRKIPCEISLDTIQ